MSHTLTRFYETVVFMFPGQAGSLVGVSREIYESEKGFRETVDVCCEDLRGEIGSDIREHLYPEEGRKHSAAPPIETMALKQPALFVTEYALAQLWIRWGVRPRAVIGHSVGEYVAACVAGVMSVKDALRLTAIRGRLFDELPEGAMLAVSLPEEEVRRQIAGDLSLAAINAPDQCVVAGEPAAVAAFEKKLNEKEIYCRRLPVNHAGHSRMTEPLLERFSQEVRKIKLNGPCLPYASNVTGGWVTADEITDAAYWVRHLREPVRFSSGLEQIMRETGRVALLEVGPGQVLSGLARLLRRRLGLHDEVRVIPSMRPSDQGLKTSSLLEALGKLRPAGIRSDDPDRSEPQWGGRQVPPRNEVEALVCETLEEILGVDKVSFHDDFFELGIDSLTVMRLVARLRKIFAKEVLPQTVFENCTAAALAQALTAFGVTAMETKGARPYGLGPGDSAPTSFGQRRLWFIHRLKGMSAEYNAVDTLRLRGELDRTILERAISAIAERHESLRTRFAEIDGEPVQIIDAHAPIRLPFEDLSAFDQISQQALIRKAARQAWQEPFDLASGPVWRLKLLKLSERDHVLLRAFHHIAFDEWSKNVFDYELLLLYGALRDNRVAALEPLPIQYVDYAIRQRARLSGESLKRRLDYWKTQLAGIPERLDLPKDRLRGIDETGQAGLCRLAITPFQVEALRKLGNANQATLYMTLLTALAVLLSRYCGQSDIVIGSPTAGRQDPQLEPLIGFFVNSLVMRINASSEQSFVELLRATRKTSLEAFLHQDLPFERLVEELSPQRSLSTSPVFQVAFVLHNTPQRFQRLESLEVEPLEIRRHWVNVDLEVHGYESNRGLELHWAYKRNLFDRRRMEQMTRHFARVLEVMVTDPGRLIRDLELTDSNEKHQLLSAANRMETARQRQDAPALFDLRSTSAPDAIALVFEDKQLSYLELNQRADQLARYLQRLGVGPEMSVGICLERSLEMVIGLLGVLKAGGAYVPLSPAYPKERLALMLEDAQALVLITQKGLAGNLPKRKSREICLDEDWGVIAQQNEESVISEVTLENLAYIIFTSGSTGRPKGVQVCRRGLCNLAEAQRKVFNVRAESRVLQFSSLSFDASIFEIVMALQHGATLCLGKQESLLSAQELIKLLRDQQITIVTLPPSVLETLPVENLPALETMIVAGEDCSAGLVTRWGRGRRFFNAYGPTETTVWAAVAECLNDGREPPIGRPIADTQIYLLDSHLQLAPAGVTGDLYIGGVGLARGYLNNPELTAEKFRPDPFSLQGGARIYNSGDLARYLPKGNLEFRGRADHQVKIRGIRIELGEIEAALRAHEHITQAVVVAGAHASGRKQLVAYIVAKPNTPPIKINELRTALRQRLPDYMLPTAVVQLPTLPMTPNGKTDRRALPAPEPGAEMGRAPRTPQEEILCLIFAEALGIDSVGVDSDFFACGGHSLLVMRLINQIRSVLRVDLPLRTVFESPTPGGLASRLNEAGSVERALTRRPQTGRLPLSFAQRQLWLIDRLEGGAAEYNTPIALRLRGRVDLSALEQAVNEIVARHEVLRACFRLAEEEPIQQILPALTIEMPLEDLSSMGEATKREAISAAIRGEWEQPFDLAQGPLLRMRLLKLADQEHLWILTFHHIVFDARSLAIFNSELTVLYEAFHERRENPLPSLPLQYADFTLWQRDRADEETLERELNFWRRKLAGLPEQLGLLTDRPRPARQTFAADSCGMRVPAETATALKRLGQANQATLYMTLLSVFAVLLSRYSGQETVVVGSPIANREEPELEGLIGLFLNTLVMRVDVRAGESFDQLLAQVRATALEAYRHQTLPFERLVKELSSPRSLSSTPIFQVLFVLQNEPAGIPELKGLEVERVEINPQRARFDIEVHLRESTEGMEIRWVYNRDLFDRWRMEQMTRHFARLLEAASTRPQCRIGSLDMLSEEEKKTFAEWNRTERPIPPASLAELLEAQAERTPEAVAVISEQQQLTYAELNLRANQLAHALIGRGVGPEGLVGICLERSVEMIIAMAAVLKAGAAYLPLDTDYPPARVALMIDDAKPALILTSASVGLNACHSRPTMVLDDRDSARAIARNSQLNPGKRERERALSPAHPAYVIYTSGSTGTPKGVVMPAVALMNLLAWQRAAIPGSRGARTAQFTAFSFDVAAQEILSALTSGKTLVIPPGEVRRNPNDFAAWLEQHRISELFAPNLMIQALCRTATEHGRELESLTQIAQAGEALVLSDEVRDFFDLCPSGKRLHNHYGPSETHVTTACALPPDPAEWPMTASIGRPIWNTRIHLLDGNLELVPQGVIGELYVAGVAVARGYLNRSALTAERFWPDPYGAPGERMYRTGDLAWRRTDGALEFARRADHQIKIRGFRVEPGEIEATLRRVEGVKQCAVIACEDGPGMKRLVAYLVPGERYPGPDFLRQALRETLPDYMMPSAYVEMESLPLLPSGKLDRWSLPPLGVTERTAKTLPVMPQNRWESLIAAVWQEKLLLDKISIHDNFFEVGGHSLLAIQVHTELQKLTGRPLLLTDIFRYPTVASLAEYLARGEQKQELSDLNGGFDQLNQRLIARKERLKRRPRKPQI